MPNCAYGVGSSAGESNLRLKVGDRAPDFSLPGHEGNAVKLGDYRGKKNVVLVFFVLAHTPG